MDIERERGITESSAQTVADQITPPAKNWRGNTSSSLIDTSRSRRILLRDFAVHARGRRIVAGCLIVTQGVEAQT